MADDGANGDPAQFQRQKSEMYARQLVSNAFQITDPDELEQNEQARHIYERLKADLERVFNEELPLSDRCWGCGKMRKEPEEGTDRVPVRRRPAGGIRASGVPARPADAHTL